MPLLISTFLENLILVLFQKRSLKLYELLLKNSVLSTLQNVVVPVLFSSIFIPNLLGLTPTAVI